MSVISKVYDSILFKRHEKWFKRVLCETQGVAQNNCSSLNTALMLQKAVYANTCVYVALLDVKKAFDSVWINGMLYKLIKLGVDKRLLRIISDSYNGFQCTVRVCGLFSEWFIPKQSIHQGDIFSMFLYCVCNNDLLEELRDIPCAVKIGNLKISGVGFADDISVMSTSLYITTLN